MRIHSGWVYVWALTSERTRVREEESEVTREPRDGEARKGVREGTYPGLASALATWNIKQRSLSAPISTRSPIGRDFPPKKLRFRRAFSLVYASRGNFYVTAASC